MLERLKNLAIPLPEDIQKQEDAGYFAVAQDLIDRRLAGPLPHALRERLELEKNRLIELEESIPSLMSRHLKCFRARSGTSPRKSSMS